MPALKSPEVLVHNPDGELRTYYQETLNISEDPENLNGEKVMLGQLGLNPISSVFNLHILPVHGTPVIKMSMHLYEEWDDLDNFITHLADQKVTVQKTVFADQTSLTVSGIDNIIAFRETLRGEYGHLKLETAELFRLPAHPELSGVVVDDAIKAMDEYADGQSSPFHANAYSGHDWQP